MAKPKNLKDIAKQFETIGQCIAEQKNQIEIAALTAGAVPMIRRIFGDATGGGGGVTLDGSSFGEYNPSYFRNVRLNRRKNRSGGNTLVKNLVLTGAMRASIKVGTAGGKNVLGFVDSELAKIARFQEDSDIQINEPIFGFNELEIEETNNKLKEELSRVIQECSK